MDVEREIDDLYARAPEEFTAARNDLAKRLQGDEAKRVRSLEKPNAVAWTLNQLARHSRKGIEGFLDVGDDLRAAEHEAMGGGGAAALREASANERRAVDALVGDAEAIAREAGTKITPAFTQRLGDTLRAAVVDPDAREALLRGRLTKDLQRVGFIETAVPPPRARAKPREKKPAGEDERRARDAERQAREEADRLAADARHAAHELERVDRALRNAEREAERTQREAAEAAERAKEAKRRAADAKKARAESERAADRATKAADAAAAKARRV